jgi:hypothetical protein
MGAETGRSGKKEPALTHPAIRQHHKLLARGAVAQLDDVAFRLALGVARRFECRLALVPEGPGHAVV